MNKTWLIIRREYLSRVRKKTFILTTILVPLLFIGLLSAVIYITVNDIRKENVAVYDPNGLFKENLESSNNVRYDFTTVVDSSNFAAKGYSILVVAPNNARNATGRVQMISDKSLSRSTSARINKDIESALENNMISQELKIDPRRIDSIRQRAASIQVDEFKRNEQGGQKRSNFSAASAVGYFTAFLIYITLFIYGTMVMRGVMEEKTNRIAEVVVSSVKPFQLMLGKILGIGAVGLTQFLIWILLIAGLGYLGLHMLSPETLMAMNSNNSVATPAAGGMASGLMALTGMNWWLLGGCFAFYFIGGYLFYASLFAAVGSAVNEDPQDAQSLAMPVTLPIIMAIFIMMNAINDPLSSLAVWSSQIPFFSPIVMMARLPFGVPDTVPYWQLGLSMVLLVAGFLITTWISARIYRTGILMYGKKPSLKELIKWTRNS